MRLLHYIYTPQHTTRTAMLKDDTYLTIDAPSQGIYKEKGSRFLAFAFPVATTEEAKMIIEQKRREYHDARHVCYAYRICPANIQTRQTDDGEPSGTAGKPILGQIASKELVNVIVVVVRYFGGVKLGTGGLAVAYKTATDDALQAADTVARTIDEVMTVSFGYLVMNSVMKIVKEMEPQVLAQQFDMSCEMTLQIRRQNAGTLRQRLAQVEGLRFLNEKETEA